MIGLMSRTVSFMLVLVSIFGDLCRTKECYNTHLCDLMRLHKFLECRDLYGCGCKSYWFIQVRYCQSFQVDGTIYLCDTIKRTKVNHK